MRDRSIDVGRGILVIMMVYGHVMQFFGDTQLFPLAGMLIDLINLTVFPTFVFYFGMTSALAYLSKPYRRALPGMLRMALRAYAAFVISAIGFRVLRENKAFAPGTVRRVMQLTDIPGWSEFLIAFALYALVLCVLFPVLRQAAKKPGCTLIAGAICLLCCELIPYDRIASVRLSLLIGGTGFSYFPVVQYMPYFLGGMVYAGAQKHMRLRMAGLAGLASAAAAVKSISMGHLPGRFPPDWAWIALPALLTAAVVFLGDILWKTRGNGLRRGIDAVCAALIHLGSKSLFYLLASNLVLFTMGGKNIIPQLSRKSVIPWTMPIQSPRGALCWTAALLLSIAFMTGLAGRGAASKHALSAQKEE